MPFEYDRQRMTSLQRLANPSYVLVSRQHHPPQTIVSLGQFSEMDRLKVSEKVTIRIGILLAIGLLAGTGCSGKMPAAVQPQPPKVTVAMPERRTIVEYVEFPGQTDAVGEVEVRARVSGYIVKIHFEDGQEVKQGDVLFEIDPRPYQLALDRATGELAHSRALLETAKADVSRTERLRPMGAVSEDEYEHAVAELKVQQAAIQTAEAVLDEAKLNLEFTASSRRSTAASAGDGSPRGTSSKMAPPKRPC